MKLETKIAPHDFVIVIRPHLTKDKRWNGEVSVKCVLDERNPLNDEDFEGMLFFTRQVCASIPLMEDNKVFREAAEKLAEKYLPMEDMLEYPKKDKLTLEDDGGNVIHVDFKKETT
tara:strand:- start:701 stop:1048 length:348 start_codon:yes stop_codon:yes gene_type:complete